MIPSIINLKIQSGHKFRFRLWLPVFILWPIFIALFLIVLPFLVIAEIVLRIAGAQIYPFRMLGGVLGVVSSLRGTTVKVDSPRQNAIVNVAIY
jgi:hypothetical protein